MTADVARSAAAKFLLASKGIAVADPIKNTNSKWNSKANAVFGCSTVYEIEAEPHQMSSRRDWTFTFACQSIQQQHSTEKHGQPFGLLEGQARMTVRVADAGCLTIH